MTYTRAMHALELSGLRAGVAGREVLEGIDLLVRSGEVHAVMGPNGSGKSTLANVVMGKPGYTVLGGSATLDGRDLLDMATWQRARAGLFLAPQYPVEVPGVPLGRALDSASDDENALSRLAPGEIEKEAANVGLDASMIGRSLNVDLSGGERKRSETFQLAVLQPRIALLDELDSGLDVDGLKAVARRISAAVGEWGLGVVAITHYQRLLKVLEPDMVHVLVKGRVVASGGPELAREIERSGYAAFTDG
jgi:Fe-S cluster assembly ATP-binding protein